MKNVTYINAGAGSGKTYRLTETLTALIKAKKVKPSEVILTTFTTKAANEFKEKAKAFLYDEGLYDAAIELDHAMIGTVHSVCQRLIGKYWFHLGLSPSMGVMAEEDTAYYISQSLSELPTEEELKVLHQFARYFDLREMKDFRPIGSIDYNVWQGHLKAIIGYATNYEIDDFSRSEKESLSFIRGFVRKGSDSGFSYEDLKAVVDEHEQFLRSKKQSKANDERIEKLVQARRGLGRITMGTLKNINSTIGTPKGYGPLAADFQDRMSEIWTSKMVYEKQEAYIRLLFSLACRWKENFALFKKEKNLLDYNDMEKYMRLLLKDESVAREISLSYRYLFVDEFQDSSPIQVKIFDALSDLMEHSFWVGDYKQAIYGFRGSDIALTKAVVDRISLKKDGCDTDTLDTSWRSLPDIVQVNNAIFKKTFAHVLDEKNITLKTHRENSNGTDSLRFFLSSDDAGVAEHILKLLSQQVNPHDIAVLARTNSTLKDVSEKLKEYGIPSSREDFPIIELGLYDEIKKVEEDAQFGITSLQSIINSARVYEEHCVQMNLPATVDGFIAYMGNANPTGSGDAEGVQLHTYHSSKGLQWKYVIMMSLNTDVADVKSAVKTETYGVHPVHCEQPSAGNPYPEVYIRLTPWIYGTDRNVPDAISAKIEEMEEFKIAFQNRISESNRLLYVGMTRPQDVLILDIEQPKKGKRMLGWAKDVGIDSAASEVASKDGWDIFGTGHIFKDMTLTQEELDALEDYGVTDSSAFKRLDIEEPSFLMREPRYISPSQILRKGKVGDVYDFNKRIALSKNPQSMAQVGDCIHQIFAGMEEKRPAYRVEMKEIIGSYHLSAVLTDEEAITDAWNNLYGRLEELHGKPLRTYHERPFRLEQDGQSIVGSIDLVWQTADGNIVVDYKTNPMGPKAVLDPENEHFVGWYAGQLEAYQAALEAAGEKVIKRYIYYPVNGLLVELAD